MARYGLMVPASDYTPFRDWIEQPERTGAGNIVLRVNREQSSVHDGSRQLAHVVLTPAEVETLAGGLLAAIGLRPAVEDPEQCVAPGCEARAWSNGACGPHQGALDAEFQGAYR